MAHDPGGDPQLPDDVEGQLATPTTGASSDAGADVGASPDGQPSGQRSQGRRPRVRLGRITLLAVALSAAFMATQPSTMVSVRPGPTPELTRTLAGPDANPALREGGQLRFTTIAVDRLTWAGYARCQVTDCATQFLPPTTGEGTTTAAAAQEQMSQAQKDAAAAAAALVGSKPAHPNANLNVQTGAIGGPSAGLMMTLAFTQALSSGDLTGGADIAGTGSVTSDGRVGSIVGIEHKVRGAKAAGATVFLAPAGQAAAAAAAADPGLTVVPVRTATEALRWLCEHGGQSSSACPTGTPR